MKLLGAAIAVSVQRILEHLRAPDSEDIPRWHFRDQRLNAAVLDAVRAEAQLAWDLFAESLSTIARLRRVNNRGLGTLEDSHNVSWRMRHLLSDAHDFVGNLVIASIEGMAQARPEYAARVLDSLSPRLLRGLERSITKGLAVGDPLLANRAVQWLCDQPSRFRLGDGYD